MRCVCCDWSPNVESEFHSGLVTMFEPKRLYRDKKTGDILCDECYPIIEDVIEEDHGYVDTMEWRLET